MTGRWTTGAGAYGPGQRPSLPPRRRIGTFLSEDGASRNGLSSLILRGWEGPRFPHRRIDLSGRYNRRNFLKYCVDPTRN